MKKRLVFTLLFENGEFVLSRNFRTQRIGDLSWLQRNYNFASVAKYIDELVVINVSGPSASNETFVRMLSELLSDVFVPVTAGGNVQDLSDARSLFRAGADKILFNTAIFSNRHLIESAAENFGQQAIVASIDVRSHQGDYFPYAKKGSVKETLESFDRLVANGSIGEIYLNSIDRDGTGNGIDLDCLNVFDYAPSVPLIIAGGAGTPDHLAQAIKSPSVSAVATANLLNFIGDGLQRARQAILDAGVALAQWGEPTEN